MKISLQLKKGSLNKVNCTKTRMRNALHAVGPLAADLRAYLSC